MNVDTHPWWHYGHLWLVLMGPLVVVVASIATYVIAASTADEIVLKVPVSQTLAAQKIGQANSTNMLPALVGRNHAATLQPAR